MSSHMETGHAAGHPLYGLMAEFETATELVHAARLTREAGFRKFDAFSPLPIHELDDAMDLHDNRVSVFTFIGGLIGMRRRLWISAHGAPRRFLWMSVDGR